MNPNPNTTQVYALIEDKNHASLQVGNGFKTVDDNGVLSPVIYTNGSPITIKKPLNAVAFIVAPSTDLQISEDPTMTSYDIVVGGSKEAIDVGKMDLIYIQGDSAGGSASFRFLIV